ncbi:MAG: DUF1893 domain-containing protein [Ruminococcaceae bacterium]|nr:DUF1893 domain-containing protein [Oscillospiraceae bacterium]
MIFRTAGEQNLTERMKQAEQILQQTQAACVVIQKDGTVVQSELPGIRPLMGWLEQSPEILKGACVADKVVGKAAALLMLYGGVAEVCGELVSQAAIECLKEAHVPLTYGKAVPYILNRDHTGMCPMEQCCREIDSPKEAYEALKRMIQNRKAKSGT